ncbi:MAG: class I SAM-dependent methyltransferase [Acidobacteriota bacterium]|nr:class I SAM-dependent methyltransferase [Acidobacteriota bacterium]
MGTANENLIGEGGGSLHIPAEVFEIVDESMGVFFEPIAKVDRRTLTTDFLDLDRCVQRTRELDQFVSIRGKKLLDIGSGYGTNLATCIAVFGADGYGVEPSGVGFGQGYVASRKLLAANGIDPERIINSTGESLPFPDESFDIVYSANVLEHTQNPEQVLREAMRVLRSGGHLYIEIPNFLSYFEGHYMVVAPPILWKPTLAWWVQIVFRRDPAFARTLQTKINPIWCRRQIRELSRTYRMEQVSLGEDKFLKRLSGAFVFEAQVVQGSIGRLIKIVQAMNVGNWIGHLLVGLQAHYPIFLTLRKGASEGPSGGK